MEGTCQLQKNKHQWRSTTTTIWSKPPKNNNCTESHPASYDPYLNMQSNPWGSPSVHLSGLLLQIVNPAKMNPIVFTQTVGESDWNWSLERVIWRFFWTPSCSCHYHPIQLVMPLHAWIIFTLVCVSVCVGGTSDPSSYDPTMGTLSGCNDLTFS